MYTRKEQARTHVAALYNLHLTRPAWCRFSGLLTVTMSTIPDATEFEFFVGRLRGGPSIAITFIPHFVLGLDIAEADDWTEEASSGFHARASSGAT